MRRQDKTFEKSIEEQRAKVIEEERAKCYDECEKKLYDIFTHFGALNQQAKLAEEVGEFADAFNCYFLHDPIKENFDNIIEELADIKVVLAEFEIIIGKEAEKKNRDIWNEVALIMNDKIERTINRIESGYYEH